MDKRPQSWAGKWEDKEGGTGGKGGGREGKCHQLRKWPGAGPAATAAMRDRRAVAQRFALLFPRVAPPRPRRETPVSVRIRCTNPYDRPVDAASDRMLSPASYLFLRSAASFVRSAPVTRVPFFSVSVTRTSR